MLGALAISKGHCPRDNPGLHCWRRAERAGPPLELLELLNKHFGIVSFDLTSDTHS